MKLLRYSENNIIKVGVLDQQQRIRDASSLLADLSADCLADSMQLQKLMNCYIESLPLAAKQIKIEACIHRPRKIICAGFNSRSHVEEMGLSLPDLDDIIFFFKSDNTISGAYDPLVISKYNKKVDWEGELAVVIAKEAKDISAEQVNEYILGYCCFNDVSDRWWQFETEGKQHSKGKCFDTFAPIGPYLVTPDEIGNPWDLDIRLSVNGELRQSFNTSDYLFRAEQAISYFSKIFTLYPGDIIAFGSGPGNAKAWGDAYLQDGDEIEFSITGLGAQKQKVELR